MNNQDYLFILKAIQEIPFNVGKNLLVEFLQGGTENKSIVQNKLDLYKNFGTLAYSKDEITNIINELISFGFIETTSYGNNKYAKVLQLTEKGINEITNPIFYKKVSIYSIAGTRTEITDDDRKVFLAMGDFLKRYNDEQKKSIVSGAKNILCIAGAGSGKTTVLTKRIEFLNKYRSVLQNKILAITFTRKARTEMKDRLESLGLHDVNVETFNSFCEKILKKHGSLIYDKETKIIDYKDKIIAIRKALTSIKLEMPAAINIYFTSQQQRSKTPEQLANIFMNDCFFVVDYLKSRNITMDDFSRLIAGEDSAMGNLMYSVCNFLNAYMKKHGLRTYMDQLLDALRLLKENKELIPSFEHILIDEYQDINDIQIELIELLEKNNLFVVGDPRQSIFGWRGSDIKYILSFKEKHNDAEIISLTKNYRSSSHIVKMMNASIRKLGFTDLESTQDKEKDIKLISLESESAEFEFVCQAIENSSVDRNEIFVLARTNRLLNELSEFLTKTGISHIKKSDEMLKTENLGEGQITLATVHAIKGLEANTVFIIGATGFNFPCKASEHPVIDMIKEEDYDKDEEERRLFYVAISRAKEKLYISYSGKFPTFFVTDEMKVIINGGSNSVIEQFKSQKESDNSIMPVKRQVTKTKGGSNEIFERLRKWRYNRSKELNIPAYMILTDKTLIELSEMMPIHLHELEEISGFGQMKIRQFGKDVLKVING